jgi:hypothetical protein
METFAKEELIQWFPIRSFPSKVSLQTESEYLKIPPDYPKDFTIPTAYNTKVAISFKPAWICKTSGILTISDLESMDELIYEITCIANEPKH